MSELIGQTVQRYQVESEFGRGSMGTVYQAYDLMSNRLVALKIMHEHLTGQMKLLRRFTNEVEALKRLEHPHIIPLYDSGLYGNRPFFVTELLDGIDLRGRVRQLTAHSQLMSLPDVMAFGTQLSSALEHMRQHQVVHRDIKPENIFLKNTASGKVDIMVMDFGLAELMDAEQQAAKRSLRGSAPYIAPEVILGNRLDVRSDLYSLGVVLYELLTGRQPFNGSRVAEILRQHVQTQPVPLRTIQAHVPADLEQLILRLLAKRPDDRYQTGAELAAALASMTDALVKQRRSGSNGSRQSYDAVSTDEVVTQLEMPEYVARIRIPDRINLNETWYGGEYRLLVGHEHEPTLTYELHKTVMTIGRALDNDIVLNDYHVSGHHCRIEQIMSQTPNGAFVKGWQLLDPKSTNGVYNSQGERLETGAVHLWEPHKTWRIGPYFLQWEKLYEHGEPEPQNVILPVPEQARNGGRQNGNGMVGRRQTHAAVAALPVAGQSAESLPAQTSSNDANFLASLAVDTVPLARSEPYQLQITVRNKSNVADHIYPIVRDQPQGVVYDVESTRILPGEEKTLTMMLSLAHDNVIGGQHEATVLLKSQLRERVVTTLPLTLQIAAVRNFHLELQPTNIVGGWWEPTGKTTLQIFNNGNETEKYKLRFSDPNNAVKFEWSDKWVTVPAQSHESLNLTVTPNQRPWLGKREARTFRVQAAPDGDLSQEQDVQGQYEILPRILWWFLPFGLFLCTACFVVGFWVNGVVAAGQEAAMMATAQVATIQYEQAENAARTQATIDALEQDIGDLRTAQEGATAEEQATIQATIDFLIETQDDLITEFEEGQDPSVVETAVALTAEAMVEEMAAEETADAAESEEATATPQPTSDTSSSSSASSSAATSGNTAASTNTPEPETTPTQTPTPSPEPPDFIFNANEIVDEGVGEAVIPVTLGLPVEQTVQLEYTTFIGTAEGADFQIMADSVTWLTGTDDPIRNIEIPITDDIIEEDVERFTIRLEYDDAAVGIITVSITDNDGELVVFAGESPVNEGGSFTARITLSDAVSRQTDASCEVTVGSDTESADFTVSTPEGGFTWDAGETGFRDCVVNVAQDSLFEGEESFNIRITNLSSERVIYEETISIADSEDPPTVGFAVTADEGTEAPSEFSVVTIHMQLSGQSEEPITVQVAQDGGTAIQGADFNIVNSFVIWPSGDNADRPITINLVEDNLFEGDEFIELIISSVPTNVEVDPARDSATVTIRDGDMAQVIITEAITITESNTASSYDVTVESLLPVGEEIEITASVTGDDHCRISETENGVYDDEAVLSFVVGETTTKPIYVKDSTINDINESTETCMIAHETTDGLYASIGESWTTTTVVIQDDEADRVNGVITFAAASLAEGDSSVTGTLTFTPAVFGTIDVEIEITPSGNSCTLTGFGTTHSFTFGMADSEIPSATFLFDVADDDIDEDDPQLCTFTATFQDSGRLVGSIPVVAVDITETEVAEIIVSEGGDPINEGETDTIVFRLNSEPIAPLTISIMEDNSDNCTVTSDNPITIQPETWETSRAITVLAESDGIDEALNHDCVMSVSIDGDPKYEGEASTLQVEFDAIDITDEDTSMIAIAQVGGDSPELVSGMYEFRLTEADADVDYAVSFTNINIDAEKSITVDYTAQACPTSSAENDDYALSMLPEGTLFIPADSIGQNHDLEDVFTINGDNDDEFPDCFELEFTLTLGGEEIEFQNPDNQGNPDVQTVRVIIEDDDDPQLIISISNSSIGVIGATDPISKGTFVTLNFSLESEQTVDDPEVNFTVTGDSNASFYVCTFLPNIDATVDMPRDWDPSVAFNIPELENGVNPQFTDADGACTTNPVTLANDLDDTVATRYILFDVLGNPEPRQFVMNMTAEPSDVEIIGPSSLNLTID